jgi:hypothetical protein
MAGDLFRHVKKAVAFVFYDFFWIFSSAPENLNFAFFGDGQPARDITELHPEGRCMHRPTALGGAFSELHRPIFFLLAK